MNVLATLTASVDLLEAARASSTIKSNTPARALVREQALTEALKAMAICCQVSLAPTRIDQNGEYEIVAINTHHPAGNRLGQFGAEFAGWISRVPWRTNEAPARGVMHPKGGWCLINHFDVERLVIAFAATKKTGVDPVYAYSKDREPIYGIKYA